MQNQALWERLIEIGACLRRSGEAVIQSLGMDTSLPLLAVACSEPEVPLTGGGSSARANG